MSLSVLRAMSCPLLEDMLDSGKVVIQSLYLNRAEDFAPAV